MRITAGILAITLALTGCAGSGTAPATSATPASRPGAINSADSTVYDALTVAQSSIEQAKLSTSQMSRDQRITLNKIIAAYNAAMESYKSYHALAASGSNPDPSTLQSQVANLTTSIASLVNSLKGAH